MASLSTRAIILVISRLMNFGVQLISPMFLVRILEKQAFGQYREFIVYASLLVAFIGFSIQSNLLYFVPRFPQDERKYVTNTALLTLASTLVGTLVVAAWRDTILSKTSYDFFLPLIAYAFCFLNLDFLTYLWLARKRSDYVLYYSTGRITIRMVTVVLVAYLTRHVLSILWALVILEAVKLVLVLLFMLKTGGFTREVDGRLMKEQLRFIVPLGLAAVVGYLNKEISKLFISVRLGAESLALYAIGSYQVPILQIVRSAIGDVIFPEMSERNREDPATGLRLWQKANVVQSYVVFPAFAILFFYSSLLVTTLFTGEYRAAVPIFQIYLFNLLRQCFEVSSPLRAMNRNKTLMIGSVLMLLVNVAVMITLFEVLGLTGPAVAVVVAEAFMVVYCGRKILQIYGTSLAGLFLWRKLGWLTLTTVLCLPILFLGELAPIPPVARALVSSAAFGLGYVLILRWRKIDEVETVMASVRNLTRAPGRLLSRPSRPKPGG